LDEYLAARVAVLASRYYSTLSEVYEGGGHLARLFSDERVLVEWVDRVAAVLAEAGQAGVVNVAATRSDFYGTVQDALRVVYAGGATVQVAGSTLRASRVAVACIREAWSAPVCAAMVDDRAFVVRAGGVEEAEARPRSLGRLLAEAAARTLAWLSQRRHSDPVYAHAVVYRGAVTPHVLLERGEGAVLDASGAGVAYVVKYRRAWSDRRVEYAVEGGNLSLLATRPVASAALYTGLHTREFHLDAPPVHDTVAVRNPEDDVAMLAVRMVNKGGCEETVRRLRAGAHGLRVASVFA
jgi:hypothetical protein